MRLQDRLRKSASTSRSCRRHAQVERISSFFGRETFNVPQHKHRTKPRGKALDVDNFVLLLRLCGAGSNCGERAKACQRQKDAGQHYAEAD